LAQRFAGWVRAEPDWEVVAPHPLSVVCLRHAPHRLASVALDEHNARIVDAVNAAGDVFLATTRLRGELVIRLAIGNERTRETDVRAAWDALRAAAASVDA